MLLFSDVLYTLMRYASPNGFMWSRGVVVLAV